MGKVVDIRGPVVDEFGELERRVAEFRPTMQRHEALKKQIEGWFDAEPADQALTVDGKLYQVLASPRAHQRKIKSLAKLFRRLGKTIFLQVATVPLKAIEQHVPATEQNDFLEKARTGSRTIKAVAKAPAGKAA